MNFNMKKLGAVALTVCMLGMLGSTALAATEAKYTKTENVYVRLEEDGEVSGTYVVNTFDVTREGEITDYGDYTRIQNLTNLDAIESDKTEHTFRAKTGKFYYQGDMKRAELPWDFSITYTLDDTEMDADELAGREGDLEIALAIRENPAVREAAFAGAYMLQVSFTLDPDLCDSIYAEGAMISDAGGDQKITFVVSPGQVGATEEGELILRITTEVKNFEMDDITINGVAVAAIDAPLSFVDAKNSATVDTTFIISAQGVTIPDPQIVEDTVVEESFLDKLKALFE